MGAPALHPTGFGSYALSQKAPGSASAHSREARSDSCRWSVVHYDAHEYSIGDRGPDLVSQLSSRPQGELRNLVAVVAREAVARTGLDGPLGASALDQIGTGEPGMNARVGKSRNASTRWPGTSRMPRTGTTASGPWRPSGAPELAAQPGQPETLAGLQACSTPSPRTTTPAARTAPCRTARPPPGPTPRTPGNNNHPEA